MTTDKNTFLLVDDDPVFSQVLARALARKGFDVAIADSCEAAITAARTQRFDRAVVDLKMEGPSGLTAIAELKALQPEIEIVMLTGYSSIATTVEAIKLGALNYLCKPAGVAEILAAFDPQLSADDVGIPSLPPSVDRLEWEHIQRVLKENDDNISATARALGMHRRTLQRKLQKRPVQR